MANAFDEINSISKKLPQIPSYSDVTSRNGYSNPTYYSMDSLETVSGKTNLTDTTTRTDLSVDHSINSKPLENFAFDNLGLQNNTTESVATCSLTRSTSLTVIEESKIPWYKWRPRWSNIKCFVVILCILQCVNACLTTGYLASVLSTIEKHFNITSKMSGFVVSSYEIGSLLSVVFVSYFGTPNRVPRWIGIGGLVLAIGSFLFALPNVLPSSSKSDSCPTNRSTYSICHVNSSQYDRYQPVEEECVATQSSGSAGSYVYILIIAQIFLGAGASPLLALGTSYIDNHAEKSDSALYIGKCCAT